MATEQKTTFFGLEVMETIRQLPGTELVLTAENRARFLRSIGCQDRGGEVFFRGARLVVSPAPAAAMDPRAGANPFHPVCFLP